MTKTRLAYVATTTLLGLAILPGAIMNILQPDMILEMVATLALPLHLLTLMGIWKLLGLVALAQPRFRRLNEFAYAGFFFDLSGAAYLHAAVGDFAGMAPALFILCLVVASYVARDRAELESTSSNAAAPAMAPST